MDGELSAVWLRVNTCTGLVQSCEGGLCPTWLTGESWAPQLRRAPLVHSACRGLTRVDVCSLWQGRCKLLRKGLRTDNGPQGPSGHPPAGACHVHQSRALRPLLTAVLSRVWGAEGSHCRVAVRPRTGAVGVQPPQETLQTGQRLALQPPDTDGHGPQAETAVCSEPRAHTLAPRACWRAQGSCVLTQWVRAAEGLQF